MDWESRIIETIAGRVTRGRLVEARERVEKLRELGLDITWEEVEAGPKRLAAARRHDRPDPPRQARLADRSARSGSISMKERRPRAATFSTRIISWKEAGLRDQAAHPSPRGAGPGSRGGRGPRPGPSRSVFRERDARRPRPAQRPRAGRARSLHVLPHPDQTRVLRGDRAASSTLCPRRARISTAGSSPTSPSARSRTAGRRWSTSSGRRRPDMIGWAGYRPGRHPLGDLRRRPDQGPGQGGRRHRRRRSSAFLAAASWYEPVAAFLNRSFRPARARPNSWRSSSSSSS